MDKALWNQVQPLLDKAIDMPAGERTAWLMRLREESPTIADELQRLLAREGTLDRRGFLDTPTSLDSLVGRMVDGSTATYQRAELERALAPGYELQAEVGRGGMATVFRARDTRHGRDVAIKVIRPDAASVLGAERFLAEIRLTANLTHPNILPLLDSGQAGGALFYVMPFIEGETLRARMRREGALPVDDVRRVLRSVLEALAHAHEKGLVHRDIKPDNVLLAGRQAWVADFGIAKAIASSGTSVHAATSVGVALGSPGYMAPEQIEGSAAIDARTDLYAVGAMAWEMLAGRPVFTGESMQQLFMRHLTAVPESLQAVRSDVPTALADAVMRCLAKAPGDRWPSATALLDALDAPSGADVAVHLPGRRGVLPRVAASLAIAVAGFLFWSAWDGQRLPTLGAPANITAFGDVGVARISPNAKWIVFRRGTEPAALWIQPADSGSPRRLAAGMPGLLGWIDDTTVFTVVPRQRPRMVSLGNPRSEDLAWAPTEGTWSVSAPGLVLFSPRREPGDSMQRMFWAGPAGWRDSLVIRVPRNLQLAWMAGDASAGVTAYGLRSADSAIAVIAYRPTDDADTILRVIPSDSLRLRRSIGGRPFAVASGRILYFPLLPDTLVRVDLSRPGSYRFVTGAGSAFPNDVGRDGSYLARDLKFDLRTWAFPLPRDTAEETRTIDRSLGFATDVVLSGDSSMFASIENAPGVGTARLFVQSTNGGVRRLVAEVAGNVSAPRWSPDGSRLAIRVAPTSGAAHWATLDVRDGSLTSMAPVPGVKGVRGGAITLGFPPAWSGDGKFLFAPDVVRIGEPRLRRYSLAAGDTGVVISRFWESREGYAPEGIVTSPDGRHLVVGGASLVVVPVGGGREREILKPDSVTNVIPIRWDSDGQVIYAGRDARRAGDEMHELWSVRATGGPPTSLGALPAPCTIHIMLVRDGRLATCYSTQTVMDIVRRRGLTR